MRKLKKSHFEVAENTNFRKKTAKAKKKFCKRFRFINVKLLNSLYFGHL